MASPSDNDRTAGRPRSSRSSGLDVNPSIPTSTTQSSRADSSSPWAVESRPATLPASSGFDISTMPPLPQRTIWDNPMPEHWIDRTKIKKPFVLPPNWKNRTSNNMPSGSGSLTDTSEPDLSYQNSWSNQIRNLSGNSSPSRQRTETTSSRDMPFPNSQPPAAIGQRTSLSQTPHAFDEPGQHSNHSDTRAPFSLRSNGRGFGAFQNNPYSAIPSWSSYPSNPESHASPGGQPFGEVSYETFSTHYKRPSISALDQGHHTPGFHLEANDLSARMNGMSLDNANGISNGITPRQGLQPSQPSQLNPSSRSWDSTVPFMPDMNDMYVDGRRLSGFSRSSPAEVAFHNQRSFPGTPKPGPETWARPASRDPRNHADSGRALMQPYLQGQPQQYHPGSYGNPQMYLPYPAQYDNFSMPVNGNGYHGPISRQSRELDCAKLREYKCTVKPARPDRQRHWELQDIFGFVRDFCGDQQGSRFIQDKLTTANTDEKETVCNEILAEFGPLAMDVFGNYVVQKLFEYGTQAQKKMLADKMRGQVVSMSLNSFGCRVVQHALDHILSEQVASLARELEPDILKIIKDTSGNHVVQKVIQVAPRKQIGFIMDALKGRVGELSVHGYACRVVQRALEYGTDEDKRAIVDEIHACIKQLVPDQYGNYVAQHVIEHGNPEDRSVIIAYVTKELIPSSRHKYASNVVEKCIVHGTDEERRHIVAKFVGRPGVDDAQLQGVMKDSYGNYVVQKLLKTLEGPELAALKDTLKPHLVVIKRPTGLNTNTLKHIVDLEKLVSGGGPSEIPASPTPASPGLQGNGGSTVPTPNLTTEPNSPSSNPPSTEASSVGDGEHQTDGKLAGGELNGSVTVHVRYDGC